MDYDSRHPRDAVLVDCRTHHPSGVAMKLHYMDIERYKYMVLREYVHSTGITGYHAETPHITLDVDGTLTVQAGYMWDGASGPTIDDSTNIRASLVHDSLYEILRRGLIPQECRKQADKLLHDICLEDGMVPFRADYYYCSVRACASRCAEAGTQKPDAIYEVGKD